MLMQWLRAYVRNIRGATAAVFGLVLPVMVGAVGMTVDLAQGYMARERLSYALDAAALAAASSGGSESEVRATMEAFLAANYPDYEVGHVFDIQMSTHGNDITVEASVKLDTAFIRVLGIDHMDIDVVSAVRREVRGLEVVLVLDNTGSMRGQNIQSLRTASSSFVNIIFDRTNQPELIKIGLVPYSTSVNVGPYGLGLDYEGAYYDEPFMNNPNDLVFDPSQHWQWHGCVLARPYPDDIEDVEGPWNMYRYTDADCGDYSWCPGHNNPNYVCPDSSILPMTSDRDALLAHIDGMEAQGHTLGNYGMVWGYRTISPEFPFREAAPWHDQQWRKAVIMMTDGRNTMHPYYSAYGRTSQHSVRPSEQNARFADVCETMKDQGIRIYTITFESGVDDNTKDYYRDCATDPSKYYDAPNQDDLIHVFEAIARELSNIHIRN